MKKIFRGGRIRKGISIVAAMMLLLNTVLPTVPVFAETKAELQSAGVCTSVDGTLIADLNGETNYNIVAQIGSSCYTTLAAAVAAVAAEGTVTLNKDITITSGITVNKKFTLNLGEHKITGAVTAFSVVAGGDLTITATSEEGGIKNTAGGVITISDGGKVTINEGKFEGTSTVIGVVGSTSVLTVNDGFITGGETGNKAAVHVRRGATANIHGGDFIGKAGTPLANDNMKTMKAVYAGGEWNYCERAGKTCTPASQEDIATCPAMQGGTINIDGGYFAGRLSLSNGGEYNITAGTFKLSEVAGTNCDYVNCSTEGKDNGVCMYGTLGDMLPAGYTTEAGDNEGELRVIADATKYTVTYTDGVDGVEIFADQTTTNLLVNVATPAFVGTPSGVGYIFVAWTPSVAAKVVATDATEGIITYTATWACDDNYGKVGNECLSTQQVACNPAGEKPEHSHYTSEEVTVNYVNGEWETAANCGWACDDNYGKVGNECLSTQQVACTQEGAPAENASYTLADVTINYVNGEWEIAENCAWTCNTNYTKNEAGTACESIYQQPADSDTVVPQEGTTADSTSIATPVNMNTIDTVASEESITDDVFAPAASVGDTIIVLQETKNDAALSEQNKTEAQVEGELAALVTDTTKTADMKGIVDIQFIEVEKTATGVETEPLNEKVNFNKPVAIKIPVSGAGISKVKVRVKHTTETNYGTNGLTKDADATCTAGAVDTAHQYDGGDVDVVNGIAIIYTCSASSFVAYVEANKLTPSSGGGGGGGSSSYSCKNLPANAVANNKTTPKSNTNYSYDTDTSKVCTFQCKSGYAWNEKDAKCELSDSTTTEDNTGVDSDSTDSTDTNNISDEDRAAADAQALKDGYSQEFIDAYNFARKNNITTKDTIREADMDAPLTRIAMAKMLSQYAINVLGKTPDTTKVVPTFPDVSAQLDADYNNGVTLAYQLGIMGIGIENFRPFAEVTRAEFGTALSRMLFGLADGEGADWYKTHLDKLMNEKIITNDNPNLKELRGYVMIMLMRSAQ